MELPHSRDAEEAFLGSSILDESILTDYPLDPEHFHIPRHRVILKALKALQDEGSPINLVSITEQLRKTNQVKAAGGMETIIGITDKAPSGIFADQYQTAILEHYARRQAISFSQETQRDALDLENPEQLWRKMDAFLASQRPSKRIGDRENIALAKRYATGGAVIPTGFESLDKLIGGITRNDLTIIAARTSVGKSSFAHTVGLHMAEHMDGWGLVLSPDQAIPEILALQASRESRVPLDVFRRRDQYGSPLATPKQTEEYLNACDKLEETFLSKLKFRSGDITLKQVYSESVTAIREGAQFIILDTVNRVRFGKEGKVGMLAELGSMLKGISSDWDVPTIGLAQVRREVEVSGERPTKADIADAPGTLAADANMILMLHRSLEAGMDRVLKVGVAKAKASNPGIWIDLGWVPKFAEVTDNAIMAAVA